MAPLPKLAVLVAALLMLAGMLPSARADFGDSFLGDLVQPSTNQNNGGTYKDLGKGYGTCSIIDTNVGYSWEVDIFYAPVPTEIELALALPGMPRLLLLTDQPSADGVSFGSIAYDELTAAIAASPNPSASLKDGSIFVVAKFAKPAGSALLAPITDGSELQHSVYAPPSPPSTTPPAPDMYAQHAGVTPDIFFAQLDGLQTYILESGLTLGGNGTGSVLLYYWSDTDSFEWELELNGVANPEYMQLRIFNNLVDQPVLFNVTPDQPWDPNTISYTGRFPNQQLKDALAAVGRPDGNLHNHTPDIFLDLVDGGGISVAEEAGDASTTDGAALAQLRRRRLSQTMYDEDEFIDFGAAGPEDEFIDFGAAGPSPSFVGAAPAPAPASGIEGELAAGDVPLCAQVTQESRILGFLFDSNSRWKLKPVLKDVNSLPKSVEEIPLYVSAGIIAIFGLFFIAFYIAGMLEEAAA